MPTTWNPADLSNTTLSGSNLTATANATSGGIRSLSPQRSGKQYWEVTAGATFTSSNSAIGVATSSQTLVSMGSSPVLASLVYFGGQIWTANANTGSSLGSLAAGSVVGVALDMTAFLIWFRLAPSGNWNGSGTANPATGVGGLSVSSLFSGVIPAYAAASLWVSGDSATANFGGSTFIGAVPSGFSSGFAGTNALATQIAAEQWITTNPPAQITQVALEMWASVQATYPVPTNPTFVLSGSRAGVSSVVVR